LEQGANHCVGIELSAGRVELAKQFLARTFAEDHFTIQCKNIHDASVQAEYQGTFDLIVLKDVIEHIHDRPKMMKTLKALLKTEGAIFFGFAPWLMPFGGNQ
jgi:2-polyprenyl-3-methyl-5-hydroxy-6-metoxy-1,4-benzoquinol methylase